MGHAPADPDRQAGSAAQAFGWKFPVKRKLLIGGQGIALEEFLSTPAERWLA
jgi:hypothetical protein